MADPPVTVLTLAGPETSVPRSEAEKAGMLAVLSVEEKARVETLRPQVLFNLYAHRRLEECVVITKKQVEKQAEEENQLLAVIEHNQTLMTVASREITDLRAQNGQLSADVARVSGEMESLRAQNGRLSAEMESLRAENGRMSAEMESLRALNTRLLGEVVQLRQTVSGLCSELNDVRADLRQARHGRAEMSFQLDDLRAKVEKQGTSDQQLAFCREVAEKLMLLKHRVVDEIVPRASRSPSPATTPAEMALRKQWWCRYCLKRFANGPGRGKCGGCSEAWYCSGGCQKADWPAHKSYCKAGKSPMGQLGK